MDDQQRLAMVRDILRAERDILALAEAHGLSPWELAKWVSEEENEQCLVRLCMLADLQTQALLSRYRLFAATNLIRMATREEGESDSARKACLELLKLDLKRLPELAAAGGAGGGKINEAEVRDLLFKVIPQLEEQLKQVEAERDAARAGMLPETEVKEKEDVTGL